MDGRGADYEIHGDSLTVHFDPPVGAGANAVREVALYRFVSEADTTRLLVYGFDLGRQGLLLYRVAPAEPDDRGGSAPSGAAGMGGRR